jgi:16S rRNA (guanine527-N7)-methyltransferase
VTNSEASRSDEPPPELAAAVADACSRQGLAVPPEAVSRMAAYAGRLWVWNERLNLTRHTDVDRFVARDVADAIALVPHLAHGERVLDVGTGGGVPGVLLAILRPDLRVELSESVGKRGRAVAAILAEIGLPLPIHEGPAQELVARRPFGPRRFDTLVVRAVAPLAKLLAWFEPLADSFGRMLVIKGPRWEEELEEARRLNRGRLVSIRRIASWPLAGADGQSVLLEIRAA